jgi:hypothetical protein
MTDEPAVSRFVLRKGALPDHWMIWDRETRGPAKLDRGIAARLSEEQARQMLEHLRKAHGERLD